MSKIIVRQSDVGDTCSGGVIERFVFAASEVELLGPVNAAQVSGGVLPMKTSDYETLKSVNTAGNIQLENSTDLLIQEAVADQILKEY